MASFLQKTRNLNLEIRDKSEIRIQKTKRAFVEHQVMALCEQGYLCDVCGLDVEELTGSSLYLRYVLGEVPPEKLHILRERHIRCNPVLAQFIVDLKFEPVRCEGAFAKEH